MPLYEYRCTSCGNTFEKIQSFSAEPDRVCPKCGGELIRPITAPALRFEGAGWYVNDYAGKGGAKPADSSPAAASKDGGAESKPASGESSPAPAPAASATPSTAAPSTGGS